MNFLSKPLNVYISKQRVFQQSVRGALYYIYCHFAALLQDHLSPSLSLPLSILLSTFFNVIDNDYNRQALLPASKEVKRVSV